MNARKLRLESLEERTLLAVVAGGMEQAVQAAKPTEAAEWVVNTLEDPTSWDTTDEVVSLREAIGRAETGDTIVFDDSLAGGTITLSGSQLSVSKGITIDASSIDGITINANGKSRVFYISGGDESNPVALSNLTIIGGNTKVGGGGIKNASGMLTIKACGIIDNTADDSHGGGILNEGRLLTVVDSVISRNFISGAGSYGGGIYNATGSIVVTNSSISENISESNGAGICNESRGSVTINDSTFLENSSGWTGGGIINLRGTMIVINTTFSGNTAYCASGAIYNSSGTLVVTNSRFSNNTAKTSSGGGISNTGTLEVTNSIFSNNIANSHEGGGIRNSGSRATIINCTFVENSAQNGGGIYNSGNITIVNSVIVSNLSGTDCSDVLNNGSIIAYNNLSSFTNWTESADCLIYDSTLPLFTDIENNDFTLAYASQAFNVGNNDYVNTEFDIAGNQRIINGIVDIGAYEYNSSIQPEQLKSPTILSGTKNNYISYGANRHRIVWDKIENCSEYELIYSTDDGKNWVSVITSENNVIITKLNYGEDITYCVRALRNGLFLTSDWSAEKTFNVCPMDINNDGDISGPDRALMASAWGAEIGDEKYRIYADINGDGDISGPDRTILGANWGYESDDPNLLYPRPVAADLVFAEFESADIDFDADAF